MYAMKQEHIQQGLLERFLAMWKCSLDSKEYEEDLNDHRLHMELGMHLGVDEMEEEESSEGEGDMELGDDASGELHINMENEDLGWG